MGDDGWDRARDGGHGQMYTEVQVLIIDAS